MTRRMTRRRMKMTRRRIEMTRRRRKRRRRRRRMDVIYNYDLFTMNIKDHIFDYRDDSCL